MEALIQKKWNDPLPNEETQLHLQNIPFWTNTLVLPERLRSNTPQIDRLQKELNFVLSGDPSGPDLPVNIFVSEHTDFLSLCRYLPFMADSYRLFRCDDRLILEQLAHIDHLGGNSETNEAALVLRFLLEKAAELNASDIHIESLAVKKRVRMRIHGGLQEIKTQDPIHENLFYKIKLISGMDIAKSRVPQDGHFQYLTQRGKKFDLRTATIPGVFGEKIVIRLLPVTPVSISMDHLGYTPTCLKLIRSAVSRSSGFVLFSGPTGSGKTTSLYAILNELNSEALNIVTIEDPVEYRIERITQVAVNEQAGVTFSTALRSFLRQDPDVILVGEIRDSETAKIACRAAQTGHLVLSTLHSNNVFESIQRLRGLNIGNDDIASSLSLIVSQRLVNKWCTCHGQDIDCPDCFGTGYCGRMPVMSILQVDQTIRNMIAGNASVLEIEQQALSQGFEPLRSKIAKMVQSSLIKPDELDQL